MKNLEQLSFEQLLDILIKEEDTDIEKIRVKKFILNNFCENPQRVYLDAMEELKNLSDDDLFVKNSRICARDIADDILSSMEDMSFEKLEDVFNNRISIGKNFCKGRLKR